MNASYRDNPENTPLLPDGTPMAGGPWVKAGNEDFGKAYCADSNNGVLGVCTAVDPTSLDTAYVTHIAPNSSLNRQQVEAAKFSHGLGVPYSNGESAPAGSDVAEYKKHAYAMRQMEERGGFIGNLMDVTGMEFTRRGEDEAQTVPVVTDGSKLGTFKLAPTGVLAYVDSEGHTHISGKRGLAYSQNTQALKAELVKLGIPENDQLEVPFARGELAPQQDPHQIRDSRIEYINEFQQSAGYRQKLMALDGAQTQYGETILTSHAPDAGHTEIAASKPTGWRKNL